MLVMAATRTSRSLSAAEQLEASKKLYVKTEALRETKQPPPGGPTSPPSPLRDRKQLPPSECSQALPPKPPPVPPRPPRRTGITRTVSMKLSSGLPPVGPPPPLPPRRKSTSTDDRGEISPTICGSIDKEQVVPPVPPPRPSKRDNPSAQTELLARKSSTPLPPLPFESRMLSTPLWARQSSPNLLKFAAADLPFSTTKNVPCNSLNTPSWAKKSLPSLVAGDGAVAVDLCDSSTVHARSAKSLYSQPSFDDDEIEAGGSRQQLPAGDCSSIALSDGDDLAPTNATDSFFDSMGMSPAVLRSFDQQLLLNATSSRAGSISSLFTSITNTCGWSKADSDSIASDLPANKATGVATRRPVSIIEKNARVIKWIHGCRVAPTPGGEVRAKVIGFEFGGPTADM